MSKLIANLRRWSIEQPDAVALRYQGGTWTWQQLHDRVCRLARALADRGVVAGTRVAFLDKNHPAAIELVLAAAWLGAVTVPVNYRLAPAEIAYILDDSGTAVVIAGERYADEIEAGDTGVQVIRLGDAYEVLLRQTPPFGDPGIGADCFLQIYTSGTTGFPKGVELTHRNLEAHTEALGTRIGFTHESVNMAPMPLYHVGGLAWALIAVYRGTPLVLARDVVPAELVDLIERFRVTHAFVVPRVLADMLEVPRLGHRDLSSLRALTYGAAPMPLPLLRRTLDSIPAGFFQVYGATEISGAATALIDEDHQHPREAGHLSSAGRPLPGVEIAIADPDTGSFLSRGQVGEVLLRSSQVMRGYWKRPEATAEVLLPGGWLRTGDLGRLDEHGYLFVVDRVKDMIISGGENIYPAELERVLGEHPGVADVAVVGVPDEKWGETPKAFVVPGAVPPSCDDLLNYCRTRLASYKLPRSLVFVPELSRNGAGKVLKQTLRQHRGTG
ncbi:long-chain-fatty-acid--CoA ligase [Pseudonocardia adelaidensis]|uniref:Long-chain fatty acid--CoA ligase n=1 Tax=Pseudonocardia adelaidensis TaxID=648754 RepID=A0ABP9NLU7_9PSEU